MKLSVLALLAAPALCIGCTTVGTQSKAKPEVNMVAAEGEKISLDETLEEYDEVTLVDDDTGEERLICKRLPVTGSKLGKRKVCATRKQWDQNKQESRDSLEGTQRRIIPRDNI